MQHHTLNSPESAGFEARTTMRDAISSVFGPRGSFFLSGDPQRQIRRELPYAITSLIDR
jgi:hypothetical protein